MQRWLPLWGLAVALSVATASHGKQCPITDHGGATGSADNAPAIASALKACSGGGTVVVPAGQYKTGPVVVTGARLVLELQEGATLTPAHGPDSWPHDGSTYTDFMTFTDCQGCGLSGSGTLFGRGGRPPVGDDWYYLFDEGKLKYGRPKMLVVTGGSSEFTMHGVTVLDAPGFNVALNGVAGAEVSFVNITSRWYLDPKTKQLKEPHNTDGIDPGGGSSDIHIHHCFISNGDDSVAVKPSSKCTRNILVEDSVFELGHGCSIGSVGHGCVENVAFRNITMRSQLCGCRVKSYSEGQGYVRNISWTDIRMAGTRSCLSVNDQYKPTPPHPKFFINVSDLVFKNVVGEDCGEPPEFICPPESPCTGILLDNVKLSGSGGKPFKMNCQNAYGKATDGGSPSSCLK